MAATLLLFSIHKRNNPQKNCQVVLGWGQTHAVQALTNAATLPNTAVCHLYQLLYLDNPKRKVIQIVLIQLIDPAVHLVFRSLVFLIHLYTL